MQHSHWLSGNSRQRRFLHTCLLYHVNYYSMSRICVYFQVKLYSFVSVRTPFKMYAKYDDPFSLGLRVLIRTVMKGIHSFRHLCSATKRQLASLRQSRTRAKALKQRPCLSSFQRLSLFVALQGCLQERIPFIRYWSCSYPI